MELGDDDSDYDYQYESHSDEDVYMDYDMDDVEDGYANAERDTGFARQQLKHAMLGSDEPMKCSITERKQMKREMYKMVDEVAEVLCLPKDDVVLLLNYFNWDDQKLKTKWFDNETQVRPKFHNESLLYDFMTLGFLSIMRCDDFFRYDRNPECRLETLQKDRTVFWKSVVLRQTMIYLIRNVRLCHADTGSPMKAGVV